LRFTSFLCLREEYTKIIFVKTTSSTNMEFYKKFLKENNASCDDQGSHSVCWIPSDTFAKIPINRWRFNRPEDADRVAEIHEWMKTSRRMDGIIYLALIGNELVCYESNHRREALKGLPKIHHLLVDIFWNANDELIKAEFMRLNKAVSVPELYLEESTNPNIELTEAVKQFCDIYKKLKVNTNKPQRPNFNRDMLMDEFYRIMRENKIGVEELVKRLTTLNDEMSKRDRSKLLPKVIQKCEETNLWLFAWSSRLDAKEL